MRNSNLAFHRECSGTPSQGEAPPMGLKQSWMLDHSAVDLPPGKSPFGPDSQEQWNRLMPLERLMLFDADSLNELAVQEAAIETARMTPGHRVIDACCGVGGNAIAFALAGKMVTAIDVNSSRLEMAQFNATLFGVADRIRWVHGNALDLLPWLESESVFIDPNWGQPRSKDALVGFEGSKPNIRQLVRLAQGDRRTVVLRLPLCFDFEELSSGAVSVRVSEELVKGELTGFTAVLGGA